MLTLNSTTSSLINLNKQRLINVPGLLIYGVDLSNKVPRLHQQWITYAALLPCGYVLRCPVHFHVVVTAARNWDKPSEEAPNAPGLRCGQTRLERSRLTEPQVSTINLHPLHPLSNL